MNKDIDRLNSHAPLRGSLPRRVVVGFATSGSSQRSTASAWMILSQTSLKVNESVYVDPPRCLSRKPANEARASEDS